MLSINILAAISISLSPHISPDPLAGLLQCSEQTDSAQKLICYESESQKLAQARASGTVRIISQESERRDAIANFGRQGTRDETTLVPTPERIETTLRSSTLNATGKRLFSLDDGSIWEQTDQNIIRISPRAGSPVVIRTGALGSYFIKIDTGRDIRVRRLN